MRAARPMSAVADRIVDNQRALKPARMLAACCGAAITRDLRRS